MKHCIMYNGVIHCNKGLADTLEWFWRRDAGENQVHEMGVWLIESHSVVNPSRRIRS